MSTRRTTALALLATLATLAAQAAEPVACSHPALARGMACVAPAGIDPNHFLVQPPASTRWLVRGGHANFDHPAVAVARMQRSASVDANHFIVQPPVSVTWTVQPTDIILAATPAQAAGPTCGQASLAAPRNAAVSCSE